MIRSTIASSARSLSLAACFVAAAASPASAEPSAAERTLAEALFREGRQLTQEGRHAQACEKFAESQRLDPGGGTLLNLGLCHEQQGKLATAWTELREALAQARAESRADRIEIAEKHIALLEPKLPRIELVISPESTAPGFIVEIDGVAINRAAWGSRIPVDPGAHVVRAHAPGHAPFQTELRLEAGKIERVVLPALVAVAEQPTAPQPVSTPETPAPRSGRRTGGYIAGGLGLAALGIGSYFGVQAIDKRNQSDRHCPTDTTCTKEGVRLNESALENAWIANGAIGLGLVGVAVGTYLVLTSKAPERAEASQTLRVDVRAGRAAGEIQVRGAF